MRLFYGQRELNLMNDLIKEVTRDVVGQRVFYYAVSELKTKTGELYNEAIQKIWDAPIELPAMVSSPDRDVKTDIFGPESLTKIEVFLHNRDLIDIGINVSVGDFVRYGDTLYEIGNVTSLNDMFAMVEQNIGIKLTCVQARKGQFDAPQLGPSDIAYSDPDAVQKTFEQTRGSKIVEGQPTGDKRELLDSGVLEPPITGPNRVVEDDRTGSDFYGEK